MAFGNIWGSWRSTKELLNELGGAWDLPPKPNEKFQDRRLDPLRMKAQLLIEGFDSAGAWGWKDPRSCLTLPFWQSLLPGLKTLIIVPNPLEVAYSMWERNGTSCSFGLRLRKEPIAEEVIRFFEGE